MADAAVIARPAVLVVSAVARSHGFRARCLGGASIGSFPVREESTREPGDDGVL
jgi:hypothetical protein